MGRADDAFVRVQTLGGTWETIGYGGWRGYWPEQITASANLNGSDSLSFTLKRDPYKLGAAELRAFTPVELEVAGVVVWEGYIWETPTIKDPTTQQISVSCRGWQYSLDDDQYARLFVSNDPSRWVDYRQIPGYDWNSFTQGWNVGVDGGIPVIAFPANNVLVNVSAGGMLFDCGPGLLAKSYVLQYEWNNGTGNGNMSIVVESAATPLGPWHAGGSNSLGTGVNTSTIGTGTFNSGAGDRYVRIYIISVAGGNFTPTGDLTVRFPTLVIYGESAYTTGNISALTSSTIVKDVLTNAVTQVSSDTTGVASTSFAIPDFFVDEPKTAREIIEAANTYNNWRYKVAIGKKVSYQAQATYPAVETRDEPGSDFSDTSANAAEPQFNKVIVTGTGPDGLPVRITRTAVQSAIASQLYAPTSPGMSNPSFASNITGWTVSSAQVAWDSTQHAGASGGSLAMQVQSSGSAAPVTATSAFNTGTFKAGVTYILRFWARTESTTLINPWVNGRFGAIGAGDLVDFGVTPTWSGSTFPSASIIGLVDYGNISNITTGQVAGPSGSAISTDNTWEQFQVTWTPAQDYAAAAVSVVVRAGDPANNRWRWYDDFILYTATPTLLDRWARQRTAVLPISSTITPTSAAQLGDMFLNIHARTPFKGTWKVTGQQAVDALPGGNNIHPAQLLLSTSELVRFRHLIDPDTGGVGRDGIINTASYSHDDRAASIDVDNTRTDFEALLARLAAITQVRTRY